MTKAYLFLALTVPFLLAGCGGRSSKDDVTAAYCPQPMTVQDAQRITRFKDGPGRDPRDVVYEAALVQTAVGCTMKSNMMDVDVVLRIVANAGPSVAQGATAVPYFVRVLDGRGNIVQGTDFVADFKLSTSNPRGASQEELTVHLPFQSVADVAAFRIAVGLKPSAAELQYNRRATAR
jgi:hypothetical protein